MTGNERFRARGEAFQEQKEAVDKSFRSPAHLLTATVEGFEDQLSSFSEAINEGQGERAAQILGGGLAQAPLMAETGGAMRVTPGAALVTAEGRIIQTGGAIAMRGGPAAATGVLLSGNAKDNDVTIVQENTPSKNNPSQTKQEPAIKERQREGARRERETQADLEREHPNASVQREQLLRDASGRKVKDPLTETGRRVDHVVIEEREVARSVETTSPTADKAAQTAKEQRVRGTGGNFVRDRRTGELVPIPERVKTEVIRRK